MQLDELYLRLPPGKEGEVLGRGHTLLEHCLLLSGRHTIVDRTCPRPFRGAKNKQTKQTSAQPKKWYRANKTKISGAEERGMGPLASTERSLMDTGG